MISSAYRFTLQIKGGYLDSSLPVSVVGSQGPPCLLTQISENIRVVNHNLMPLLWMEKYFSTRSQNIPSI